MLVNYFDNHNWIQGKLFERRENDATIVGACLVGAIDMCTPLGETTAMLQKFERAVGCQLDVWNDAPGRTKEEVIQLIRKVMDV